MKMKKILETMMLAAMLAAGTVLAGVPDQMNYQGRLMDSGGAPVNGSVPVAIRVYNQQSGGATLWSQSIGSIAVTNGLYSFQFGNAGLTAVLTNSACWLEVEVDSETLSPRQQLVSVPYASRATVAEMALSTESGDADTLAGYSVADLRNMFTPPGMMVSYPGSSAPSGWLLCDGAAVSRTTYSNLYSAIGVTCGIGDGTSTFNVPNLKGRVIVGQDSSISVFDTLGETGGSNSVTSAHHHNMGFGWDQNFGYFKHAQSYSTQVCYRANINMGTSITNNANLRWTDWDTNTISVLQPYQVLNYIIKY